MSQLTRSGVLRDGLNVKGLEAVDEVSSQDSLLVQNIGGGFKRLDRAGLRATAGIDANDVLTLGDTTDFVKLGGAAALELGGSRTVWDDLDFAMTVRTTGANTPSLVELHSSGIYGYVYANGKEAFFQRQIPHRFQEGATWRPHVHWMPTTTATYTGTFTLDYIFHGAGTGSDISTKATTTGTFNLSGTAYQSVVTSLADIDGTDMGISTIVFARLLVTLTAGTSIVLSGMDWHGAIDSIGSKDPLVK